MRPHSAAFIALLIALAVLSLFNDSGTSKVRAITGDVVEWQGGQWISVANEQTDPGGVRATFAPRTTMGIATRFEQALA